MTKPKPSTSTSKKGNVTGTLVLSAIKKLSKNTGWTCQTITKFISKEFDINDNRLGRKVSRALKLGVRLGLLQTDRRRYRLNHMSSLAVPTDDSRRAHRYRTQPKVKEQTLRIGGDSPRGHGTSNRSAKALSISTRNSMQEILGEQHQSSAAGSNSSDDERIQSNSSDDDQKHEQEDN